MILSDTSSRVPLVINDDDLSEESERGEDANRRDNIAIQKKTNTQKRKRAVYIHLYQSFKTFNFKFSVNKTLSKVRLKPLYLAQSNKF